MPGLLKKLRNKCCLIALFHASILTSCSPFITHQTTNQCDCYHVNRHAKSFHYVGRNFDLKFILGKVYREGQYYKTTSRWEVREKDGTLLCKSPSKVYKNVLSDYPGSGWFDRVWIHDSEQSSLIFIDEIGLWYQCSVNTIVFEKNNKRWKSTVIGIPGPCIIAEGNGQTIESVDIYGNIRYEDPYSWDKKIKKFCTAHYSNFDVVDQFPPGRFW